MSLRSCRRWSVLVLAQLAWSASLTCVLTGCNAVPGASPLPQRLSQRLALKGRAHGGQQPVSGATLQLYTAGTSGNGSSAVPMLTSPVLSDADGNFSLTGEYTCASGNDQVYLTASGGNPGLSAGQTNPALLLATALGRCGDLSSSTYITVNEVTTVAAAWALAPFASSPTALGATASNSLGLANAFGNSRLIADPATGLPASLPTGQRLESGKVLALADALAACVNSDGGAGCTPLFSAATPAGGTMPSDTFTAALNIVKNPANHVAGVWNAITPQAPFPPTLTQAPNDWTLSLSLTGGGLAAPTALGLDTVGNVWTTGFSGVVSGFSAQGTPFNSTGFGDGIIGESYGIAIDAADNVWVSSQKLPRHAPTRGGLVKLLGASSGSAAGTVVTNGGSDYFYDNSLNYPTGLAIDSNGNILIANGSGGSATVYNSAGQPVATSLAAGTAFNPLGVAADAAHNVWIANGGTDTVTLVALDGTLLANPSCCTGVSALALDPLGNVWVADYYGGSVSEVSGAGAVLMQNDTDGGVQTPDALAVDSAGTIWVANQHAQSFTELAGAASASPGTGLSPGSGFGLDSGLQEAVAIAPDRSGNVWIADKNGNALFLFFGLATPTVTPLQPLPSAP